jgi:hypothetical protein
LGKKWENSWQIGENRQNRWQNLNSFENGEIGKIGENISLPMHATRSKNMFFVHIRPPPIRRKN